MTFPHETVRDAGGDALSDSYLRPDAADEPDPAIVEDPSVEDDLTFDGSDLHTAAADSDAELSSTSALWEGDEGTLDVEQRRTLVVLVKQRFITARTEPKEWKTLLSSQRLLRSRLNDLFLDLHIDLEREVAYKRKAAPEAGGRPYPTLLYDAPWSREETVVLVCLRDHHRKDQAAGELRSYIDRDTIKEFVARYRPERATDVAGDARKVEKAIDSIYRTGLLIGPSSGERFEISHAIEVLLPLQKLLELLQWLRAQNAKKTSQPVGDEQLQVLDSPAGPGFGGDTEHDPEHDPAPDLDARADESEH